MKSVIQRNKVQRMGVQSEGTFRIKATGKAFRILSDGLYSDKITAIIRELSCNAYDAHVEAGTLDKPFSIHLPTQFEPTFSLRDFGIGLSHNDVIQVYTTYFESTKTESNDFIGCLGLGSKSPFSYVDNFTIVSFYNGEKRTYNAFMNEDSIPSIALMATEKNKEHNGVEVSFAVGTNDFRSFYSRMPNIFRYFKIQPKLTGHTDITITPVEYGLQGDGWGIRKDNNYGARAIMGNISYPLDDMDNDKVTKDEWSIIRSSIDIQFEIGELEVAASRENISFNKATINNIKIRLAKLVKEVSKQVSDELNACPTLWDARLRAVELSTGTYSCLKSIFNVGNITYKGVEIEGGLASTIVEIPKDLRAELAIEVFAPRRKRRRSYGTDENIISLMKDPHGISVKGKGFKFFIRDIDRGSHIRCKQIINESNDSIDTVYLLSGRQSVIKMLTDLLGYEDTIDPISSVERPKRASTASGDYNPMNAKRMLVYADKSQHRSAIKLSYWTTEKVDIRHGGLYVPMDRYKIHGCFPNQVVEPLLNALRSMGENVDGMQIVGVKTAMRNKVVADPNWMLLKDYVREKAKEHIEANDYNQHIAFAGAYIDLNKSSNDFSRFVIEHKKDLKQASDSPVAEYIDTVENWEKSYKKVEYVNKLAKEVGIILTDDTMNKEIEKLGNERRKALDKIRVGYPMLTLLAKSYHYDAKIVKGYIELIDNS